MMPTPEARKQRRIFNIVLTIVAASMALVFISSLIIISLVINGNSTTERLDESSTLQSCRAASTARLNNARVTSDHAQSAAILIGVDAALGRGVDPSVADLVRSNVAVADNALTQAEKQYQTEYEVSNKDKTQFLLDCRARGDI